MSFQIQATVPLALVNEGGLLPQVGGSVLNVDPTANRSRR